MKIEGGIAFCEGRIITLTNTTDPSLGFSEFIVDWGDGSPIEIKNDYSSFSHTYNIPDSNLCKYINGVITITLEFTGIKYCTEGISCQPSTIKFGLMLRPKAIADFPKTVCINSDVLFSHKSCNETEILWQFHDGTSSTANNFTKMFPNSGNYLVTLIATNECGSDKVNELISVLDFPRANFTFSSMPQNSCDTTCVTFINSSNVWTTSSEWIITPNDTNKWRFTDTLMNNFSRDIKINFYQKGTFTIELRAKNVCGDHVFKDTIVIYESPKISMIAPNPSCDSIVINPAILQFVSSGDITSYAWLFENGTPSSSNQRLFQPVKFYKSGNITLQITSPCGDTSITVAVNVANTDPIDLSKIPDTICLSNNTVTLIGNPVGGWWSGNGIDSAGNIDLSQLSSGRKIYTYHIGTADCPKEANKNILFTGSPLIFLWRQDTVCNSLNYTPQVTYTNNSVIRNYQWDFQGGNPNSSTLRNPSDIIFDKVGTYIISCKIFSVCGDYTVYDTIVVEDLPIVQIDTLSGLVCSSTDSFDLVAFPPGGKWSGQGIMDSNKGTFNPSLVAPNQFHTVYYVLDKSKGCIGRDSIDIYVQAAENLTIQTDTFCSNDLPKQLFASQPGGDWSGQGISDPILGIFDPSQVLPGFNQVTYQWKDSRSCNIRKSALIKVDKLPIVSLSDTIQLCIADKDLDLSQISKLNVDSLGGILQWSGPGVVGSFFNSVSQSLNPGFYPIYLSYQRNECFVQDSFIIQLIDKPALNLPRNDTVCISNQFYFLVAQPQGGRWSGPGIDPITGVVNLTIAKGGQHTYNYLYDLGPECLLSDSVTLDIIDLGKIVNAGTDTSICEGIQLFILSLANPTGGYWTGTGIIDSLQGIIDVKMLDTSTIYVYRYNFNSNLADSCSYFDELNFVVHPKPQALFSLDGRPCINNEFTLINNSSNAVRYVWDFGEGTTSQSNSPKMTYLQKGTYQIELIVHSVYSCMDTAIFNVNVISAPFGHFSVDSSTGCAPFALFVKDSSDGDFITKCWFINGDTINGNFPNPYLLDGNTQDSVYFIELNVKNLCDTISVIDSVTILAYPRVDFGITQDEGCSPSKIEFSNITKGKATDYDWDLGNGFVSKDSVPPAQYYSTIDDTTITTYTIRLIAKNRCGMDTLAKSIIVKPANVHAFIELDTLEACQPFLFSPKSKSTPGSTLYWEITNSLNQVVHNSNLVQPSFLLVDTGLHKIILNAKICGQDTDVAFVRVLPAPMVKFSHQRSVCQFSELNFLNLSDSSASYFWDFGDGNTSTFPNPKHIYDSAGTYIIKLTVFSKLDNCPAVDSSLVQVFGKPTVSITADSINGCYPFSVKFNSLASGAGSLLYNWDFSDGSSHSFDQSPLHLFDKPGSYQVRLVVSDSLQCFSDTAFINVWAYNRPNGDFIFDKVKYCARHDSIHITNISSQDAVRFDWDINGVNYVTKHVNLKSDTAGYIFIQLISQNIYSCSDTISKRIQVLESPIAQFQPDTNSGCEDLAINFQNQSQYGTYFEWYFGDGSSSTDSDPVYKFEESGSFATKLKVSNLNGCPSDSSIVQISVFPRPQAKFVFTKLKFCGAPSEVQFLDQSLGGLDYDWDFGDGSRSDQKSPLHEFMAGGYYPVRLIVNNQYLCADTLVLPIEIYDQPVSDFTISPHKGCEDLEVQLNNLSNFSNKSIWEIETIGILEDTSPSVIFTNPGVYSVRLISIFNDICKDTLELKDVIKVYQSPKADFTCIADYNASIIGDVMFKNLSLNADRYSWNFGDGEFSSEKDPVHEYDKNRTIFAYLIAFNDNMGEYTCIDTFGKQVDPEWITTFFAPNAFTPDYGIGYNVFKPVGIGLKEYELSIYSPWGEQVWYTTSIENEQPKEFWDGVYKNDIVPQGTYVWIAKIKFVNLTERIFKGTVTVIR
ncbi:MAG: PKD domain-containing protein [Saprospiraceae bacterium]|nr:PKD domain-containing protein [Saprospiraceae bacterium]